jgi:hypothetical protein
MPTETRGTRFAREVRAAYELSLAEEVLLDEAAEVIDILATALPVGEARQQRLLLSRLLGQLNLTLDDEPAKPMDGKSVRGRRAAQARWARANGAAS